MATKLEKEVRRELLRNNVSHGRDKFRAVIVSLLPGDELQFRVKGTRQQFKIALGHCFRLAQIMQAEEDYKAAMTRYNEGKAIGKKRRKPKRYPIPFGNIYYKALKQPQ